MTYDLPMTIVVGLAMAVLSVVWLWRESSRPSIVNRQEDTLTKQHERMERMQRDIDDLRRTMADNQELYEEELAEVRSLLDEWWQGMKLVFEQMAAAQLTPVWKPKPLPPKKHARAGQRELVEFIAPRFSVEEIDGLAFDLNLAKDELSGDTRQARARSLVQWAVDHNLLPELRRRAEEARPQQP